jgi:Mg/Co/Ni transporter MgtE
MVAVLRHLQQPQAEAILNECPTSRRQSCVLLLHYPVHCIGAWIVPDAPVVSSDFTVGEVLTFLKEASEEAAGAWVFVVNREGLPEGRISYLALLKADVDQRVQWIMDKPLETLAAQMPLMQAAKLPCWRDSDVMPVVGAQHQFVGVLRHADLRRSLQQDLPRVEQATTGGDPLSGIFDVYGLSLLALFDSVSNAVEK